ncbi:hypothetical protein OU790_19130, partial [Ruegeria sp. NA]|nr:hypothetical protein [Ruegeria sp. NA]
MPARILVVDVDPDILEVTRFAIEKAGYAPLLASDGLTALDTNRQENLRRSQIRSGDRPRPCPEP